METLRSGGIEVRVPLYPRLTQLKNEQDSLRKKITELRREAQVVESQNQKLSSGRESYSLADLEQVAQQRAELKKKYDAFEYRALVAESQLRRSEEEYNSWLENFGGWLYRKQQLVRELGSAPNSDEPVYDMILDRDTPRSRAQIQYELSNIIRKLAAFSGDQSMLTELEGQ